MKQESDWFFPYFVLMWISICTLLSVIGGWASLGREFKATEAVEGKAFRFASGSMRCWFLPVSYGGCLFVKVNSSGFGVSILFLFRPFSPPLFLPWSEIATVDQKKFLFSSRTVIRLKNKPEVITIRGKPGNHLCQTFLRFEQLKPA